MITVTETAAEHILKYIEKRGQGIGVRLGVRTTGCSGLAYHIEFADTEAFGDNVIEDKGVKVLVDPRSAIYLNGTVIDYIQEGLSKGFKFINPIEKDRCGCGQSFRI